MLSQEVEEQLAERLVNRIEEVNTSILKKIGQNIKAISTLSPSEAYQLGQILKYGGDYQKIAKQLADASGKNVQDIYKIFDEVAKSNKQFASQFYKYRNIKYIPYKYDRALQNQVKSIATLTANAYVNIANTNVVGFMQGDRFMNIYDTYRNVIDKAIMSVGQGKDSFYSAMRKTLKELGGSGLVQYESGRTRRLDSAVRMNILDGIRQLNNETNKRFGEEYDADGIEISVHANPAPDHADIQGRQFSNEEYQKLESGQVARDYKGNIYDGSDKRQISTLNCYHKIFTIVLGVSQPEYSDAELQQIQQRNTDGFDFEGKHYTMYQGTQMQRQLELAVRKQKDINILAKASGDTELVKESEIKIRQITQKYNELCKASGLVPKKQRMSVSGYRRTHVDMPKLKKEKPIEVKLTDDELDEQFYMLSQDLKEKNVEIDNSIFNMKDKEFRNKQLEQLDYLTTRYKHDINDNRELKLIKTKLADNRYAETSYTEKNIKLNTKWYDDKTMKENIESIKEDAKSNWHYKIPEDKLDVSTLTHEYGHILEYQYYEEIKRHRIRRNQRVSYREIDKDLRDMIMSNAMSKLNEKISITDFKNKYWTRYARSKRNSEWFAETFEKYILSDEKDEWTEAFGEWLDEYFSE